MRGAGEGVEWICHAPATLPPKHRLNRRLGGTHSRTLWTAVKHLRQRYKEEILNGWRTNMLVRYGGGSSLCRGQRSSETQFLDKTWRFQDDENSDRHLLIYECRVVTMVTGNWMSAPSVQPWRSTPFCRMVINGYKSQSPFNVTTNKRFSKLIWKVSYTQQNVRF
jgi:hypothetical protein